MSVAQKYVPFSPSDIEKAREPDLLTYMKLYEPNNLVRISGNIYCTKDHDSLKISNGKWYWWSRGIGGVSALDYLIKVKKYSFVEAVETIIGRSVNLIPPPNPVLRTEPKELLLPKKYKNNDKVISYLLSRGINFRLISDCIKKGIIYESDKYHNAVFVGKDEKGIAKHAACRGIKDSFKIDASGSDKKYSFKLLSDTKVNSVHLFESAIDLLSYATYLMYKGIPYNKENLLSLSGVCQPKKEIKDSKIPVALSSYLKENPQVKTIILHLDNDKAGKICTKALIELLKNDYEIVDRPPPCGKDCNDFLMSYLQKQRTSHGKETREER